MAVGLRLDLGRLQEAAAAQFFGLRLPQELSGEAVEFLRMLMSLPKVQRRALTDLIRVMVWER
jgi:hypothetical protein